LEKENGLTFLCLKEKLQKKQTTLPVDPLLRAINCPVVAFSDSGGAVS
jgi:hypothetical protein